MVSTMTDHVEMTPTRVFENTILFILGGSHLYGTNTDGSDLDFRGVAVPPYGEYYLGFHEFEQYDPKNVDLTIFGLRKFVKLAAACNPNIIELLFAPKDKIIYCDEFGESLIGLREAFLSRRARHTFTGYAHSQLTRIKNHKKWIDNPPSKPDRAEMGLPLNAKVIPPDKVDAARSLGRNFFSEEQWSLIEREQAYRAAKKEWDNYRSWKANRNPARYEMECKFGYDGKHAMHLVRLLRMGFEIISEGKVVVARPDAEELLSIRSGEWKFEQLLEYASTMEVKIEAAEADSPLPWGVDIMSIENWLISVLEMYIKNFEISSPSSDTVKAQRLAIIENAL